jgi:hypothetical protein
MFDLRKFWLGTAVYVLITGVVTAAVGAAFYVFIGVPATGLPTNGSQQVVTPTAPIQAAGAKAVPVEIERQIAAPGALPLSPLVHRTPATNIAASMPQLSVPKSLIVPEPRSTRRSGPSP